MKKFSLRVLIVLLIVFAVFFFLHKLFPLPLPLQYSTIVTDRKGQVIHAFLSADDKWRMKTELEEISPILRKAILFKEDRYFYYHPGINPLALARAAVMNVLKMKRTSGASTITMQVARMLEPKRRTYFNKAIEMFRALQLEWMLTKDEILQLYLNKVPYGSNIEGVKSASVLYLKKSPNHLSLAEVTALSIIPNRPSSLLPGRNNDRIVQERNKWLKRFAKAQLFEAKEIADALDEPFAATRQNAPRMAPHLSLKLKNTTGKDIIPTCLDMQMQQKLEKLAADYVRNLYNLGIYNTAIVVIDNTAHQVVSYIGSADFNNPTDAGQVNGAGAVRQPGSTLKPLVYGLCFDKGLLTPQTIVNDVSTNINGYAPENFDQKFHGAVTVSYALENSLNIPAVKALHQIGAESMIEKLMQCGFSQIKTDRKKLGLSLVLGGCGVTLEEMTALYSALANEGVFMAPSFTLDSNMANRTKPVQVLSPDATFMVTEILSKLARPDMPANWEASMHTPRIAWKTGTSYGRRDAWSIGYNRHYTVGVWIGNFSGIGVPELNGAAIATPLLFKIFNTIDYNAPNNWYTMPKSCGLRLVCSESGKLPEFTCTNTVMDYYIPLVSSNEKCNHLIEVVVSADEAKSYCKNCQPSAGYKRKMYKNISPELQQYFDENHLTYAAIPPHNPSCDKVFTEGAPVITFPVSGTEYLISTTTHEPLKLSCLVSGDVKDVYWYINQRFHQKAQAREPIFFKPGEGVLTISCTDDKGRSAHSTITVKYVNL